MRGKVCDTATLGAYVTGNPRLLLLLIDFSRGKLVGATQIPWNALSSLRVIDNLLKSFSVLAIHIYCLLLEHGFSLSDEYAAAFIINVAESSRCYERARLLIFEADAQLITRLVESGQSVVISSVAAAAIAPWLVKSIDQEVGATLHIVGYSFSCRWLAIGVELRKFRIRFSHVGGTAINHIMRVEPRIWSDGCLAPLLHCGQVDMRG